MAGEKRGRMRISYNTNVAVKSDGEVVIAAAKLHDISMRGVFLDTDEYLPDGLECEVEIVLNGASSTLTILAQGIVARKTDEGIGIEFSDNLEWWPVFSMYAGRQ